MKGLVKLSKNSRAVLLEIAEKEGCKGLSHCNRVELARKILQKRKLKELDDETVQPEPESDESELKPDFERLVTEGPKNAPESPQAEGKGPGGYREGAGRTPGLTDEKARVQRILKNQVPDPTVQFVVDCIFNLSGEPKKAVEPTTDKIGRAHV